MMPRKNFPAFLLSTLSLAFVPLLHADEEYSNADYAQASELTANVTLPIDCGSLDNDYGPFDYTNYTHYTQNLKVVEDYHFTPGVEHLTSPASATLIGDLDFTLRAFPNHHRALAAVGRYELEKVKEGRDYHDLLDARGLASIECYFQRAVAFKPTDSAVRLIYGTYLQRKEKYSEAKSQYLAALEINPNSSEVHYNLGLYYYELGKLSQAVMHGHKAYELGYPLPGLKEALIKKGVWEKTVSQY